MMRLLPLLMFFLPYSLMSAEQTLAIVKPVSLVGGLQHPILDIYKDHDLIIRRTKWIHLTKEEAEEFYQEHKGKPFFDSIIEMMTMRDCFAILIEGDNAVERVREINGATDPKKAKPGTIRHYFGINVLHNAVHSSDSLASAKREIAFFFPDEEYHIPLSNEEIQKALTKRAENRKKEPKRKEYSSYRKIPYTMRKLFPDEDHGWKD